MLRGEIDYGQRRIAYKAKFSKRATLEISVLPDQSVELVAPLGTNVEALEHRLRKKARWVCRQIDYFEQFKPRSPPRRYVGGETHLYLGRQCRLKIVQSQDERVRLMGGYFVVEVKERHNHLRVKQLLQAWYREKADNHLRAVFEAAMPTFERLGCRRPQLRIQVMARRWGSHSSNGTITLNPELVRAPMPCIKYVIFHEFCHLIEPNHGSRFVTLLGKSVPDWVEKKMRLEACMK